MSKSREPIPSYSRGGWAPKFRNAVTHIAVTHRKLSEILGIRVVSQVGGKYQLLQLCRKIISPETFHIKH